MQVWNFEFRSLLFVCYLGFVICNFHASICNLNLHSSLCLVLLAASCRLPAVLRFPRGVYSSWVFVGIALVDKINSHVVANFPDLLRFQLSFEMRHSRAGNPVHNLVIEDTSRDAPPFQDGEVQWRWIDVRLSRSHAIPNRSVAADTKLLIDHVAPL